MILSRRPLKRQDLWTWKSSSRRRAERLFLSGFRVAARRIMLSVLTSLREKRENNLRDEITIMCSNEDLKKDPRRI